MLDVVNLRTTAGIDGRVVVPGTLTPQFEALAELQQQGLLQHSPNIMLIPGTSSVDHLGENIAGAALTLPPDAVAELDAI